MITVHFSVATHYRLLSLSHTINIDVNINIQDYDCSSIGGYNDWIATPPPSFFFFSLKQCLLAMATTCKRSDHCWYPFPD